MKWANLLHFHCQMFFKHRCWHLQFVVFIFFIFFRIFPVFASFNRRPSLAASLVNLIVYFAHFICILFLLIFLFFYTKHTMLRSFVSISELLKKVVGPSTKLFRHFQSTLYYHLLACLLALSILRSLSIFNCEGIWYQLILPSLWLPHEWVHFNHKLIPIVLFYVLLILFDRSRSFGLW